MSDDVNDSTEESVLEQDDDALLEVTEDQSDSPTVEDLGPEIPVPVEVTGEIYNNFKEEFGEEQAALLQQEWGDKAVQNEVVVRAVMADHPSFDEIYIEHQNDDGITAEGLVLGAEYLAKNAGFNDLDEMSKAWPELDAIILDSYDERTDTLSAAGIYLALEYIGRRSGYSYIYREKRT